MTNLPDLHRAAALIVSDCRLTVDGVVLADAGRLVLDASRRD